MIRYIFGEAWNALTHYRLRSLLTMLSVIWGVASLMLLLSYGQGFDQAMTRAFQAIGKDLIVVFPGQTSMQAGGERAGRRVLLELRDLDGISDNVPTIQAISPEVRRWLPVTFGYRSREYGITGIYTPFQRIRNMAVEDGRLLTEDDVRGRRRVAIIGSTVKRELFSGLPAVGREIKINGIPFAVVGVLKKKVQISNYGAPDDMRVLVPLTTLSELVDTRYLSNIVIVPVNGVPRKRVIGEIRAALARVHNFNPRDERAVWIVDWNELGAIITNLGLGLKIILAVIGTLTLSIGAVGVMNIMLVSVTERTREIGIRMAVGARASDILLQFLVEAVVMAAMGGLLGIFLGIASSGLLNRWAQWPVLISPGIVAVAFLFSAAVGIFFGLYPARKAAHLDPIEALRYE
ncbi:MAG TPA: ABC transporter permease [Candidatus Acidoferrales bacterium]|nr:ABC transporter permease [Candidatus Acidoferrales bacterium]